MENNNIDTNTESTNQSVQNDGFSPESNSGKPMTGTQVKKNDMLKRKIGALWLETSKAGNKYLSGMLEFNGEKTRIVVIKNNFKTKEKLPDYEIFVSNKEVAKDLLN